MAVEGQGSKPNIDPKTTADHTKPDAFCAVIGGVMMAPNDFQPVSQQVIDAIRFHKS